MDIVSIVLTCIVSVGIVITFLEIKNVFSKEAEDLASGMEILEFEDRINVLEDGIKAHVENIRILSSEISKLQTQTIDLKKNILDLTRQSQNISDSINNFSIFVDKTRGMVEENSRKIDLIKGNVKN